MFHAFDLILNKEYVFQTYIVNEIALSFTRCIDIVILLYNTLLENIFFSSILKYTYLCVITISVEVDTNMRKIHNFFLYLRS